jgi:hypothetical protein
MIFSSEKNVMLADTMLPEWRVSSLFCFPPFAAAKKRFFNALINNEFGAQCSRHSILARPLQDHFIEIGNDP